MSQEPQYHIHTTASGIQRLRTWCTNIIDSCSCPDEEKNFARSLLATINKTELTRTYQEGDLVMGKDYSGRPYKFTGVTGIVIAPEINSDCVIRWNTEPHTTISSAHPANLLLIQPAPRYTAITGPKYTTIKDAESPLHPIALIRNGSDLNPHQLCDILNK